MFKTLNVGNTDRIIRIVLGAVLVLLPYIMPGTALTTGALRWILQIAGVVFIATGFLRSCPVYSLIGANTNK